MFTEIKKILRRKEYLLIAILLFLSVLLDFYYTCSEYIGSELSRVPSAYQMTILSSKGSIYHIFFGSFLFFIISNILAVPALIEEVDNRTYNYAFTRIKPNNYLKKQISAVAIVTFLTIWICLIASLLLSLSAFPIQGYHTEVTTHNRLMDPDPNRLLGWLYRYYPYLNIVVLMTLRAFIASVSSFLSCAIAVLNKVPGFICMMIPMIIFVVYSIITNAVSMHIADIKWFSIVGTYMLPMNRAGSETIVALYLLAEIAIGSRLIIRGMKNDTLIL